MKKQYMMILVPLILLIGLLCITSVSCGKKAEELKAVAPERDTRGIITVDIVCTVSETKTAQILAEPAAEAVSSITVESENEVDEITYTTEATHWTDADAVALAQMAWGEARGCPKMEQAATMWCVLNRVDAWGGSPLSQAGAAGQFYGYSAFNPVSDELYSLALDVLSRWESEKSGCTNVGRVLPNDYLWFTGDGAHNYFRNAFLSGSTWNWAYANPYAE